MIEDFIDSVLIIDDKEEEVNDLKNILEEKDIWVKYLHPDDCTKKLKARKIIFIDLFLNETAGSQLKTHISKIRKILKTIIGNENNSYGLVIWTNHTNDIIELKKSIANDSSYLRPLFIVGLSKLTYLRDNDYSTLLDDLESELKKSIAANFFINWSNLINKGKDKAITSIFKLVPDYLKQDKNLEFILYKMAQNHTGIPFNKIDDYPLYKDAYKSFTELLSYEILSNLDIIKCYLFNNKDDIEFIFDDKNKKKADGNYKIDGSQINFSSKERRINELKKRIEYLNDAGCETVDLENEKEIIRKTISELKKLEKIISQIFATINTKSLINSDISDNELMPANIYEIIDKDNILISSKTNKKDIPIVIEVTPPCDYANLKNDKPKLIGGFLTKFSNGRVKELKGDSFYIETYPLKLNGYNDLMIMAFDFKKVKIVEESVLENDKQYKIIFKAKDKLFADILQKMSSYTARLGLSIIR